MKDYNGQPRLIGVRELKTHAARIVRQVRDARASYILTHRGTAVGVILPLDPAGDVGQASEDVDAGAAWRRFRPGVSGVRILSTNRRCASAALP
jgi:prevent-host-death family protein